MGAMLWQHEVPWQPDAAAALRAVQVDEFRHRYDFSRELEEWRASAEQSLLAEQQSGDRFGLAAIWSKQLQTIADVASKPAPQTTEEQIELLRRVLPEGYGGILDVTRCGKGVISLWFRRPEKSVVTGEGREMAYDPFSAFAEIIRAANSLFPAATPARDLKERRLQLDWLGEENKLNLQRLEKQFYEAAGDLDSQLYRFVMSHKAQIRGSEAAG
jgi:hypothetical protein